MTNVSENDDKCLWQWWQMSLTIMTNVSVSYKRTAVNGHLYVRHGPSRHLHTTLHLYHRISGNLSKCMIFPVRRGGRLREVRLFFLTEKNVSLLPKNFLNLIWTNLSLYIASVSTWSNISNIQLCMYISYHHVFPLLVPPLKITNRWLSIAISIHTVLWWSRYEFFLKKSITLISVWTQLYYQHQQSSQD